MSEGEYTRLTTLGKVLLGIHVVADLCRALDLAELEGEASDLRHAYEALESAAAKLRGGEHE